MKRQTTARCREWLRLVRVMDRLQAPLSLRMRLCRTRRTSRNRCMGKHKLHFEQLLLQAKPHLPLLSNSDLSIFQDVLKPTHQLLLLLLACHAPLRAKLLQLLLQGW